MKKWLLRLGLVAASLILRLRYKIRYVGLDAIQKGLKNSSNGILFLPNHPAIVVDPMIVSIPLVRHFSIRPLVVEYMYYVPYFHDILRFIGAYPIPNFATGFNPIKLKRAEKMLKRMSDGLKNKESFLIYPAGTTKLTASERIGGAFGVHTLIEENPDVNIVLVRTTGLWGSVFSRAYTEGSPVDGKKAMKKGFWTLMKNAIFFAPKREVTVSFELAAKDFPRTASKQMLNRYLEEYYNKPFNKPFGSDGEPIARVPYSFYNKNDVLEVKKTTQETFELKDVPQEIQDKISEKIAQLAKVEKSIITPKQHLAGDLGLDSLDAAELVSFLEDHYDVQGISPSDMTTVFRLYEIATKKYQKTEMKEKAFRLKAWNKKRAHSKLAIPEAQTIPEAFFAMCDKSLFQVACADSFRGVSSYYLVKKAVLLLKEKIEKMKGERIGILLAATQTTYMLVLACQLARKTPVMINWTVGGKHLDAVLSLSELTVVLSSWTFLDNLENVDLSKLEEHLVLLEELKVEIGLFDVVKASIKALLPKRCFSFTHLKADDEAVLLFTSGTEGMPKGVPLTHDNILQNQRAALSDVVLYADDRLLSFLPPFHSFGFSVTGILPLLCGLRVVYYPNPTDARRLAKAISHWSTTVLCSAPTFLKNIFTTEVSAEKIRLLITGAEKTSKELFSLFAKKAPKAEVYEGYGITECGPILSVNKSQDPANGVGKPLSNVEMKVVDPEKLTQEKPVGEQGMIIAKGPNVFSGYLGKEAKNPFVEFDGSLWYETGDLGYRTESNSFIISGRLKRFVKFGGEMVSLLALEEAITANFGSDKKKKPDQVEFSLAPTGDLLGKPSLVLVSLYPLDVTEVNQVLRKHGFSNLAKIDQVVVVDEIPVGATGKISYRKLDELINEKKHDK